MLKVIKYLLAILLTPIYIIIKISIKIWEIFYELSIEIGYCIRGGTG